MKQKHTLRIIILATALAAGAVAAILLTTKKDVDIPSGPISTSPSATQESANVIYSDQAWINHDGVGKIGDAIVAGRCIESRKYAKTTKGDWDTYWYLVKVQIIGIEKGRWGGGDELRFIASDSWPTPESGIKVKKGLGLFAPDWRTPLPWTQRKIRLRYWSSSSGASPIRQRSRHL